MMGNSHHPKILEQEEEGPVSFSSNKAKLRANDRGSTMPIDRGCGSKKLITI